MHICILCINELNYLKSQDISAYIWFLFLWRNKNQNLLHCDAYVFSTITSVLYAFVIFKFLYMQYIFVYAIIFVCNKVLLFVENIFKFFIRKSRLKVALICWSLYERAEGLSLNRNLASSNYNHAIKFCLQHKDREIMRE